MFIRLCRQVTYERMINLPFFFHCSHDYVDTDSHPNKIIFFNLKIAALRDAVIFRSRHTESFRRLICNLSPANPSLDRGY